MCKGAEVLDLSVLFPCAMNDLASLWTFYLLGTLYVSTTLVWTSVLARSKVKQFHGVQLIILFGKRGRESPDFWASRADQGINIPRSPESIINSEV
jgi:hypothetical protein